MRLSVSYSLAILLLSSAPLLAEETPVAPEPTVVPTLTAEQPVNPASSKPGGPVIVSISARLGQQIGLITPQTTETIIPEFHFIAPNGNAVLLHREIVESSSESNNRNFNASAPINIPAEAQKRGAVLSGSWGCGSAQFYTTVSAYIMDADGNRSNTVRYTVHCNGG